jgi:Arc/MetJ family transcription regulator
MTDWYESRIERQIREAQERGDFDNLPGAGKPLRGSGEQYDENWWLKDLVRRENITGVLPATLALRKEIDDLLATVVKMPSEQSVRTLVGELNQRIVRARRGLLDGPPVMLGTVDVDRAVRAWRERRGLG